MQVMKIQWNYDAWDDYLYWQTKDKQKLKRVNALIKDISRDPFEGIGKPEPLKVIIFPLAGRAVEKLQTTAHFLRKEKLEKHFKSPCGEP